MKRFLIIACISTILSQLNTYKSSCCFAAEGYKSTEGYKGAEGYNGAGVVKSADTNQKNENNEKLKDQQSNQNSGNQQNASDNGEFTQQEREQIMQNAQKWFDNNPEQAKILNQLLQSPR